MPSAFSRCAAAAKELGTHSSFPHKPPATPAACLCLPAAVSTRPRRSLATATIVAFLLSNSCSERSEKTNSGTPQDPTSSQPALSALPGLEENRFDAVVKDVADREDPVLDGWNSERFNELPGAQLAFLAKAIANPGILGTQPLVSPEFSPSRLRPGRLETAYANGAIQVRRPATDPAAADTQGLPFAAAISEMAALLHGNTDIHSKFKTVRVDLGSGNNTDPTTRSHFQISGRDERRLLQVNAVWDCTWQAGNNPPLLKSVTVSQHEEVIHRLDAGRTLFSDCTLSVFRNTDRFDRQLALGIDHWTDRFDGAIARTPQPVPRPHPHRQDQ